MDTWLNINLTITVIAAFILLYVKAYGNEAPKVLKDSFIYLGTVCIWSWPVYLLFLIWS